ncbi:LacI family DNA-binding transcriptional regulator [Actinotignum sp. GS-2025f]|uniref:LacI family DNA-binding transcriptional regulator n=1 Tax=unclassified Actinotignum TaxID=2632702 RepID=UPI002A837C81|nr:LacI family DNA-binding transcriptional regulator [Actinotignum sp. SLA_B059]MDY5127564.1 LacI family DNA-binding transcriptional regulator [Actinotignum sp. SLA_B059]
MATIKDVARQAGVSISTVSYALSGKRPVSEATRQRVQKAIEELEFHPQAGAKMLASTKTDIIALSAPMHEATEPIAFMTFVLAIVTAARRKGYDVVLLTENGEAAVQDIERVVKTGLVDGVVVMDVQANDERAELLRTADIPSVFLGLPDNYESLACVDLDFEAATRLAVDQLVAAGHRSIAFVGHTQMLYDIGKNFVLRTRAEFERYTAELGIETVFVSSDTENMVAEIRNTLPGCTGVLLDCSAVRVRDFLDELSVEKQQGTGDPLSILTLASSYDTSSLNPPLDAVPLEPERSGRNAVELLIERIGQGTGPEVHLYTPRYISRGSVFQLNGGYPTVHHQ